MINVATARREVQGHCEFKVFANLGDGKCASWNDDRVVFYNDNMYDGHFIFQMCPAFESVWNTLESGGMSKKDAKQSIKQSPGGKKDIFRRKEG
jgi:hypothetical protein